MSYIEKIHNIVFHKINWLIMLIATVSLLSTYRVVACELPLNCFAKGELAIKGSLQFHGQLQKFIHYESSIPKFEKKSIIQDKTEFKHRVIALAKSFKKAEEIIINIKRDKVVNIVGEQGLASVLGESTSPIGGEILSSGINAYLDLERLTVENQYDDDIATNIKSFNTKAISMMNEYFTSADISPRQLKNMSFEEARQHSAKMIEHSKILDYESISDWPKKSKEMLTFRLQREFEQRYLKNQGRIENHFEKVHEDIQSIAKSIIKVQKDGRKLMDKRFKSVISGLDNLKQGQKTILSGVATLLNDTKKMGEDVSQIKKNVIFLKSQEIKGMSASAIQENLKRGVLNIDNLVTAGVIKDADNFRKKITRQAQGEAVVKGMEVSSNALASFARLGGALGMPPKDMAVLNKAASVIGGVGQMVAGYYSMNPMMMMNGLSSFLGAFGGSEDPQAAMHKALMKEHRKTQEMIQKLAEAMGKGFESLSEQIYDGFSVVIENQTKISKSISELRSLTEKNTGKLIQIGLFHSEALMVLLDEKYASKCHTFLSFSLGKDYRSFATDFNTNVNDSFKKCRSAIVNNFGFDGSRNPISKVFYLRHNIGGWEANNFEKVSLYHFMQSFMFEYKHLINIQTDEQLAKILFVETSSFAHGSKKINKIAKGDVDGVNAYDIFPNRRNRNISLSKVIKTPLHIPQTRKLVSYSLSLMPFLEFLKPGTTKMPETLGALVKMKEENTRRVASNDGKFRTETDMLFSHSSSILETLKAQLRFFSGDVIIPIMYEILSQPKKHPSKKYLNTAFPKISTENQKKHQSIARKRAYKILGDNEVLRTNYLRYSIYRKIKEANANYLTYDYWLKFDDNNKINQLLGDTFIWEKKDKGQWYASFKYKKSTTPPVSHIKIALPTSKELSNPKFDNLPAYSMVRSLLSTVENAKMMRDWGMDSTLIERNTLRVISQVNYGN